MPMKIALVAPLAAPVRGVEPCGNQHLLLDVGRGLAERGHQVVLFCAAGSRPGGLRAVEIEMEPAASGAFCVLGPPSDEAARALRAGFERLFERVREFEPDAVSQHAFDHPAIELASGLPVVHTLHVPPPFAPAMRELLAGATGVIAAVSHSAQDAWQNALHREVIAIPNGIPGRPPVLEARRPWALIAGRISREKGVATALRVAREAGLEAIVVGEVQDRDYFEQEVRPQLDGARMVGVLSRPGLWHLMAGASVVLMPVEWDEPFGMVAAEAQRIGCPVVGYRRGALPEVVIEGVGGFLAPPGDEDALAAAAASAPALDRETLRRAARSRFDMKECVEGHERALRTAARAACA
jgi:glycosyltransferase involved in cell wall biosynthesis